MYWTLELASHLEDAPWPADKDELVDFAIRTGAPLEVVENLQQLEGEEEIYDTIILAVSHNEFLNLDLRGMLSENGVVYDVKGFLKTKVDGRL